MSTITHVGFEKYVIIKDDILYIIYAEAETIFITANVIYRHGIEINDFPIYCITPMNSIVVNDEIIYYKEYDRYIVQDNSAYAIAIKLYEYFSAM